LNILGYSGLHGSIAFRRKNYANLTENEYRMCQGLDSAACIFVNGEVVAAAEEERFNGEKYTCDFPVGAIEFCLREANLSVKELDYICHGFDYSNYEELLSMSKSGVNFYNEVLSPKIQIELWQKHYPMFSIKHKFINVNHHLSHAATAFYPSGFDRALILIADGIGESHSISLFEGNESGITLINNYGILSSLGVLYSQITAHLGFLVNSDEYKIMGLAPYGNANRYKHIFDDIIEYKDKGEISINKFALNTTDIERQTGRGFRKWLSKNLCAPRSEHESVTQQHKDIAAALQNAIQKCLFHILVYWGNKIDVSNLCMAGGVALNCTANGEIFRKKIFNNIYIQPAASDAGTAMGAAMVQSSHIGQHPKSISVLPPYYGPGLDDLSCEQAINKYKNKINYQKFSDSDLIREAAHWITTRKIIAWMQGRMEFGPRALGNRSILADPTDPSMRDRINALVKKRESFRPFAPSVKLESAHEYFDMPHLHEFPHMLYTVPVREKYRSVLPAITHVDGSARVQTVNKNYAEKYWRLINEVEKTLGIPIILNTSFNVKGQPIVCTPIEAIQTLLDTNIDALFMGNYLITLQ